MKNRISLIIIFLGLLLISSACELNDWDVVLNQPTAPIDCSVTNVAEQGGAPENMELTVEFTVPQQREWEVFPDHTIAVFFNYRKTGTPVDSAVNIPESSHNVSMDMAEEPQSTYFHIPKTDLENGEDYIITFKTVGGEGRVSEAKNAETVTISW